MRLTEFTQVYKTVGFSTFASSCAVYAALDAYRAQIRIIAAHDSQAFWAVDTLASIEQAIKDFDNGRFA